MVLVGGGHRLAGVGALAAKDLHGEQIAVTAHRDGAGYDRALAEMLGELGVAAALVRGAPGPAMYRAVAAGDVLALTTAPESSSPQRDRPSAGSGSHARVRAACGEMRPLLRR